MQGCRYWLGRSWWTAENGAGFTLWTLTRCNIRHGINFPSQLSLRFDKRGINSDDCSLSQYSFLYWISRQREEHQKSIQKNGVGNLIERLPIPKSWGEFLDTMLLEIPFTEKLEQLVLNHVQQNLHKKTTVQIKAATTIVQMPTLLDRTGLHSYAGASFSCCERVISSFHSMRNHTRHSYLTFITWKKINRLEGEDFNLQILCYSHAEGTGSSVYLIVEAVFSAAEVSCEKLRPFAVKFIAFVVKR